MGKTDRLAAFPPESFGPKTPNSEAETPNRNFRACARKFRLRFGMNACLFSPSFTHP